MASQPVQPLQFLPLGLPTPQQDNAELKARVAVLEEASKELKAKLEAVQQESIEVKIELATAKAKIEEQEKRSASSTSSGLSTPLHTEQPILAGDRKRAFIDWYIKVQPVLKMIDRFGVEDQIDYVASLIDHTTFDKICNHVFPEEKRTPWGWKDVGEYLKYIAKKYYEIAELPNL